MLTPEQVPDAAAQAAHDVFWNAVYDGKSIDLDIECHRLFHYAIAAAINAWPGMEIETVFVEEGYLILPLRKENTNG